jgi:non-specific serine/threonine protein kinase
LTTVLFAQHLTTIAMASSPPAIPPSRSPNDGKWRFDTITLPCEWVEDYKPGGYHPVDLGDEFKNGQYKVIRKLGEWGLLHSMACPRYSVCFLSSSPFALLTLTTNNRSQNAFVALKLLVSSASQSSTESKILHHIFRFFPTEGRHYITQLLDEFEYRGPNGTHKCLVFEVMGPSANSMVEELPQFKPRKWGMKIRYPPKMAKSILRQSLQALAFLHENDIAHGDF